MFVYFSFLNEIFLFVFLLFCILFYSMLSGFKTHSRYLNLTLWFLKLSLINIIFLAFFTFSSFDVNVWFSFGLRIDVWTNLGKKILVFLVSFFFIYLYLNYSRFIKFFHVEYIILLIAFIFSCLLLIEVNDFLMFFLVLDFQAILLFIIIAYNHNSMKSTEAAWKYFILNGFASSLILCGILFLFYITNSISFNEIAAVTNLRTLSSFELHVVLGGYALLLLGLLFKFGIAPFHLWVAEVFDGTPFLNLIPLAVISKVSQFLIFLFFVIKFSLIKFFFFKLFFGFFGILSVILGALHMLMQSGIKQQIAFFSIYSGGFMFVVLLEGHLESICFLYVYLLITNLFLMLYLQVLNWGVIFTNKLHFLTNTQNFSALFKNDKTISFFFVFVLVSLLGLPPLIGFYPKFLLLTSVSNQLLLIYSMFFLLSTLLVIFTFIFIIKNVFFIIEKQQGLQTILLQPISTANYFVFLLLIFFSFFLVFVGSSFIFELIFNHAVFLS